MKQKSVRVMWLLNHSTFRCYEIDQLGSLGITEVFMPKFFPYNESNFSANVDYTLDAHLTIPEKDLALLNAQNWYENPSEEAWRIANEYFDVAIIGFFLPQIESTSRFFQGSIILRVFNSNKGFNYTQLLYDLAGPQTMARLMKIGNRFWFGTGYTHLKEVEGQFFQSRTCYLPVGLSNTEVRTDWVGQEKRILFVCPRIGTSSYYRLIYEKFIEDFEGFDYTIAGTQPIAVADPNIVGFVEQTQYANMLRNHCVMFYSSTEPNHIHYHPFEAIRAGMPLIFMAGGVLDQLGGNNLPGRCKSIKEARKKINKIFKQDKKFIESICFTQVVLLESMKSEQHKEVYKKNFSRVLDELTIYNDSLSKRPLLKNRIAVILPIAYSGGTLRRTKLLIKALVIGSKMNNETAEIIIAYPQTSPSYNDDQYDDIPHTSRRVFEWRVLDQEKASRAMTYAGHREWQATATNYIVPDDGINQLLDCNLWLIISDRFNFPILPIRPYILMAYDYVSRYIPFLSQKMDLTFLCSAQLAQRVMVTTDFTARNALQYAGLKAEKIRKMPFLVPKFKNLTLDSPIYSQKPYFLWSTDISLHKNHLNAFLALYEYYERWQGDLECHIAGCHAKAILSSEISHLQQAAKIYKSSDKLKKKVKIFGELIDASYQQKLKNAAFFWHPTQVDNGTLSVLEAAQFGIPSLSSDYPAMREIEELFNINLTWTDPGNPKQMAEQLKWMEENHKELPFLNTDLKEPFSFEESAIKYWRVVKECL